MSMIVQPQAALHALEGGELLGTALAWRRSGSRVAVATVIATWGSSPRPVGSLLIVDEAGQMLGSVSGGCVEAAVVQEALAVIDDGRPRVLEFGVDQEQAWEVGLACGGRISVLVLRLDELAVVERVLQALAAGRPAILATCIADGRQRLLDPSGAELLAELARAAATDGHARSSQAVEPQWFAQLFEPPRRLFVIGAVHIAQQLVPMAQLAGYATTVIDPRTAFASEARFPSTRLVRQWPGPALAELRPDASSAIVTLTHDAKLDDPALRAALTSEAFYIGALGSRRTHGRRLERLAEEGFGSAQLARIHGPVGLSIGARSPAEIAVSIVAEMTAVRRKALQP